VRHVLITGLPGSGKTTIARPLAHALGLPLVAKDAIKETLFDTLGTDDPNATPASGRISSTKPISIASPRSSVPSTFPARR
jgi:predicted kinase